MKHRTLGIIFIAATLVGNAQQPQKAQPDDPQSQDGVAPNQAFIPGAQQGGAGSSQQQPGPFERRPTPPVNWNHNHEVYPNTDQLPDNGAPTIGQKKCDVTTRPSAVESATHAVNPSDTNYGGLLSQWHQQLVHDLLLSVEFWGLMCALVAILLLLFYVLWLMRQRDQRLQCHGRHSAPTHQLPQLRALPQHASHQDSQRACRAAQRPVRARTA